MLKQLFHSHLLRSIYYIIIQLNLSTTATLGTEESGRCGEVAVVGRWGCNMTPFFFGKYNMFIVPSSSLL